MGAFDARGLSFEGQASYWPRDGCHDYEHGGVSLSDWTGTGATLQLSQVPSDHGVINPTYLYLPIDSTLDTLYEQLAQSGVEIIDAPNSFPWGMREFAVRDLDGNVLRFGTQA